MTKTQKQTSLSIIERSAMVIVGSIDESDYPNTKAMLKPREMKGLKTFYLTTNTSSMRVNHFRKNHKSSIYFYDAKSFKGLMLKGKMEVLLDQKTKNKIWRDGDEIYYKLGKIDPDYCVLKFTAESGRLYQNFSSENFNI